MNKETVDPKEIGTLLQDGAAELGIVLTTEHLQAFGLYLLELRAWGKHINLIKRADDREIISKDFVDSLTILKYLPPGSLVADLGSGAGFPGIPVKIVRPDLIVCLLETIQKKIFFLRNLERVLGLRGMKICGAGKGKEQVEEWGEFDIVVSRAFGSLQKLSSIGGGLLKKGGILLAMKGKKGKEELEVSLPFLEEMGFEKSFVEQIRLPLLGHERTLIGLKKKRGFT